MGVISDGILGLADAIASGDLPTTTLNFDGGGKLVSTTGGVIATSFRADGDLEGGLSGPTGAEGTAILEIVHDIASGAQLRFANFGTSLEFIAAVDFLAANSDVVIDDIGFFGGAYDQTSNVSVNTSEELNRSTNPIRGYYTSVGNQALKHYQELYVDSGVDGTSFVGFPGNFHHFGPTADTSDSLGLGLRTANSVFLRDGESLRVFLTWDDTFGAASTDYDLFLSQNSPALNVASSDDNNVFVTGEPTEFLAFTNTTGIDRFYDIFIQNFNTASPAKTFDMFVLGGKAFTSNGSNLNYNTIASSVPAQSDAGGGVVSAGAINAADPGTDEIEPSSSHGPTNNGVLKPDVAAVDGVSVTGSGGFGSPFFGTSAAAPHVAGLAALLLELRPDLMSGEPGDDPSADRSVLRSAIVDTAVDLGAFGPDNTFGSGRVDGINAAAPLLVAPIVDAGPDQIAAEGATVALAPSTFTDANPFDTHTAIIDWGDGTAVGAGTVNQVSNTVSGTHAYADNGNFTVMVTVTDDDGFAGSDTLAVTVNNVAPVVEAGPDRTANEGDTVSLVPATFTDVGSGDAHTATIDWGDGTPVGAGTVNQANDTVSGSHAYTDIGNFIVMVTVTDDDGGSGSDSFTFNVILSPAAIPGVTAWGMVALGVAFIALLVWRFRDQHWSRDLDQH